jgi:hypothetical protein
MSDDLGAPISYLVLEEKTPVYTSDRVHIGTVKRVLSVPDDDIFDGLIVGTEDGDRFIDAPNVEEIHERGVGLAIASADVHVLPEPSPSPAALSVHPDDTAKQRDLRDGLRRAWDLISGNY